MQRTAVTRESADARRNVGITSDENLLSQDAAKRQTRERSHAPGCTIWLFNIAMENIPYKWWLWENHLFLWAIYTMLNNQRVTL